MKNNSKLLWAICAMGLFALSCDDDKDTSACPTPGQVKCDGTCIDPATSSQYCGANASCEEFTACTGNETCQEGHCQPSSQEGSDTKCQTAGFVKCNGICIDPNESNSYCGANENCENYEVCSPTQTCTNGHCLKTPCKQDEHENGDGCEKDSLDHCGEHDFACASKVDGWKSGTCEDHKCKPSECLDGRHIYLNTCEEDSITDCGDHGVSCATEITGWSDGTCDNGSCHVTACGKDLHLKDNTCESDDNQNCGRQGFACTEGQQCTGGRCLGKTMCGEVERNTLTDLDHCGDCNHRCDDGLVCTDGTCTTGLGPTYCTGTLTNTFNDPLNCGECSNTCPSNLACVHGTCDIKTIIFGHYEQDNNTSNGKEQIEWRVIDKDSSGHYLIISDKVLDQRQYNSIGVDSMTWEKSTIRSWLNGYGAANNDAGEDYTSDNFFDTAFTASEKAKIIASTVPADKNPIYDTPAGNATTDKIFLLSIVEANKYFKDDSARQSLATYYAVVNEVWARNLTHDYYCGKDNYHETQDDCFAMWWLRSPGDIISDAVIINARGAIDNDARGRLVHSTDPGIRPALWLKP